MSEKRPLQPLVDSSALAARCRNIGPVKKTFFASKKMLSQLGVNDENRDVSNGLDASGFLSSSAAGPEAIEIEYVRTEDLLDTEDAEADQKVRVTNFQVLGFGRNRIQKSNS